MHHALTHVHWLFLHLVDVSRHFTAGMPLPGFSDGH
jgi:hypothetical protein